MKLSYYRLKLRNFVNLPPVREYPVIAENMQKLLQINFATKLLGSTFFFHKNEREYCLTIALMGTFLRLIIVQNQTRGQ